MSVLVPTRLKGPDVGFDGGTFRCFGNILFVLSVISSLFCRGHRHLWVVVPAGGCRIDARKMAEVTGLRKGVYFASLMQT